jgi:hypothetical protein
METELILGRMIVVRNVSLSVFAFDEMSRITIELGVNPAYWKMDESNPLK